VKDGDGGQKVVRFQVHLLVEKPSYVRRERFEGDMTRIITLPTHILPEKVVATYEQGVLKLHVPKSEEVKPKQIPIKVKELAGAH